ncbi:MAG: flagellar biosynthesis protein FlhF [Deferribacteres bacterium]|nr:flagellar biosynthesis protein FlhF [candidate division KSB1 bacterium]MCB9501943.1 flagellar biosynthesis protein FlhF [Deferribacteres bacterium]
MKIKKYHKQSMTDALKAIKQELGENALILSSKKIPGESGGIEVIAAIDEKPLKAGSAVVPPIPAFEEKVPAAARTSQKRNYASRMYAGAEPKQVENRRITSPSFERITTSEQPQPPFETNRVMPTLSPFLRTMKDVLSKAGVHGEIISSLLLELGEKVPQNEFQSTESAAGILRKKLASRFRVSLDSPSMRSPKIVALVGPTGVGKTTSIAKIAAQLTLQQQAKVGLISIDTYRIGAIDQLKTFAEIAEIPMKIAFTPPQLEYIVQSYSDYDYIFLDTTGRNPRNRIFLRELRHFIENIDVSEVHLTLSATTRYAELEDIMRSYQQLPFDRILFTKIDEVMDAAVMLNLAKLSDKPVSYICNGQNIPDDLIKATQESLAEIVVDGWDLDRWIS